MKRFYLAYADPVKRRQAVAILPVTQAAVSKVWRQPVAKLESSGDQAELLQRLIAEVPWGQHLLILNKVVDPAARLYYLRITAQLGWSRSVLLNQIKVGAYERALKERKTHNFALALPEHLAEQADEMLKSSYNLEFLGIEPYEGARVGGSPHHALAAVHS